MRQRGDNLFVEPLADDKAVNDYFNEVILPFVKVYFFAQVVHLVVDTQTAVSFGANVVEKIGVVFAVDFEHWGADFNFGAFRQRKHVFHHLMRRPHLDPLLGYGAARLSNVRKEHPQVVVQVRHGAHGRSRVLHDRFLFD